MVRRVDRIEGSRWKILRSRGESEWQDAIGGGRARWNRRSAEETWQDEAPKVSLADKLEGNQRFVCRVAHWLFIKGGMVLLLIPGLILLGLVGGLLGRR